MITYEQALRAILKNTRQLTSERILTEKAVGRILSEDVYSGIDMPPFNKSAMDGYAVRAFSAGIAPVRLKNIGTIQAGQTFRKKLRRGECAKIMTGAPLPVGADSVVMIENTKEDAGFIELVKGVKKKENVCLKGEDLKVGKKVLGKGEEITLTAVAILATVGRRFVEAIRKPDVGLINTGGEIVPAGLKLSGNKIYNSNGPMLNALLESDAIAVRFLGIVKDEGFALNKAISRGLGADILLISGGVSMGDYDLVPSVLKGLGVKEIFHKVNIKPGKPLFFGIKNKTLVFGIPGNPVSNFLSYLMFIRPAIYKMAGNKNSGPILKEGIVETEFHSRPGRRHFVLAKISSRRGRYYLTPAPGHGSADTLSLSAADAFMVVDESKGTIKKNARAPFITWKTV